MVVMHFGVLPASGFTAGKYISQSVLEIIFIGRLLIVQCDRKRKLLFENL